MHLRNLAQCLVYGMHLICTGCHNYSYSCSVLFFTPKLSNEELCMSSAKFQWLCSLSFNSTNTFVKFNIMPLALTEH